jgi:hypothetical protein
MYCEHNTLYNEINWFYPASGSEQINRCVSITTTQKTFGLHLHLA